MIQVGARSCRKIVPVTLSSVHSPNRRIPWASCLLTLVARSYFQSPSPSKYPRSNASRSSSFGVGDQGKQIIRDADSFSSLIDAVSQNAAIPGMESVAAKLEEIKGTGEDFDNALEDYIYKKFIFPEIPKLWYFSDYFSLPCRINLNDLAHEYRSGNLSAEEYKIANALFELSGLQVSDK